jgi:hypothetical protein
VRVPELRSSALRYYVSRPLITNDQTERSAGIARHNLLAVAKPGNGRSPVGVHP